MDKPLYNHYLDVLGYNERPNFIDKYLETPSLQRLKKVSYLCGMDYASKDIYDFKEPITRYDHSLSVALLTWKCTHDSKATLAGLYHDIATPCFSHVIDYMNKDYANQESTEEYTEEILKNDIYLSKCLEEDNIDIEDIIDFKQYPIVDNDRPRVCADRLDGVILTGITWTKNIDFSDIDTIINDIAVFKNEDGLDEIGFKSDKVAKLILTISNNIDVACHSKEDNFMMELLARITKTAIEKGYIAYDDLYVYNEEQLFDILEHCDNRKINVYLNKFKTITKDEIPNFDLPNLKPRDLNPIANGERIYEKVNCR